MDLRIARAMLIASALLVSLPGTTSVYALRIDDYTEANNRFWSDGTANPDFFANQYDLSGITWRAMMISPHYFITAAHTGQPSSVTFVNQDGVKITKTVMESKRMTTGGKDSDLLICRLNDDQGLTAADKVSYYPIFVKKTTVGTLDYSWYVHQQLLVFGVANVSGQTPGLLAGLNTIASIVQTSFAGGDSPTYVASYKYDNTQHYPNQCGAVGGDSGYPIAMIIDGQLTALGDNMGIYPSDSTGSYGTVGPFLPYYVDQINAYMALGDAGEQVTTTLIPEPASLCILLFTASALACTRCHRT